MLHRLYKFGRISRWAAAAALTAAVGAAGCHDTPSPVGDPTPRPTTNTEARADPAAARPGDPPPPVPPPPQTAPAAYRVAIDNFTFDPPEITVPAGATVTWSNRDDVPHTVTADDKAFSSGALDTDAQFAHAFPTPGNYPYYCAVHPHMTGRVVVK